MKKINGFLKKFHIVKTFIALVMVIVLGVSSYLLFLAKTADIDELKVSLSHQTVLLDDKSEEVGRLSKNKGTFVSLNDVSKHFLDAVIATEDQRFYEHKGIDPIGMARALLSLIANRSAQGGGGSTLTQQLAKNSYLTQKQTFIRKAQELFLAIEIEKQYSKDDILTMYMNHAYFGNGVWGVEDASLKYFGVKAKDLTISQSAILAGMLKGPNLYNPIDDLPRSRNRRDTVLSLMLKTQKITQEEHDNALKSEIVLQDKYESGANYKYAHFFDTVIDEAIHKHGISEEDLLTKGYKIYTTLNTDFQDALDRHSANDKLFPAKNVQTAAMVSNHQTGEIKAIVGGRGETIYRGFNRATQMYRQPGSLLKPLAVYTPALENNYQPRSIVLDEVKSYGADNYTPENWDYKTVGSLPMYQALALSKNTSAVWLLNEIGLDKGIKKLKSFGIEVDENDKYLGIALGGMTKGTTLKAINEAYGSFGNDGVRLDSYVITKIEDASGQVIMEKTFTNKHEVMSSEVAQKMTQMMMGVYEDGGTAPIRTYNNLKIAGKTGTTESSQDSSDMWATAYTKDFVYTTWIGYDQTTDENYLKMAQGDSIKPLFTATINDLLKVSKQTPFTISSITDEVKQEEKVKQKQKQEQEQQEKAKQNTNIFNRLGETLNQTVESIKDFFGNLFR